MKERLDETLDLARKTNSFGALAELLLLHALLLEEDQDSKVALEELENARQLCAIKGFPTRLKSIENILIEFRKICNPLQFQHKC